MRNILSIIFSGKQKETEGVYKCWICEAVIREETDFLYHIHECDAVKKSGLPLQYDNGSGKWKFDRKALLDKNKTNAQQSINTSQD